MRILLLFPMADGQTGPAIKYAFEQLGHEVLAVDAKIESFNSYAVACHFMPNLVFCSRTYTLAEQVAQIKKKFKEITICMWNVDTRNSIHEWEHLFPLIKLCDYYFVIATNQIPDWRKINPNTHWLPQGLQEEVYHKPKSLSKADTSKYTCDVSFAGSCTGFHSWRVPYLEAIEKMGLNFKVWGCSGMSRVYNEEHNKMVACSKINIGMSGWSEAGRNISVRDYKILGAGGLLLEYRQDGIFDVFPSYIFGSYGDIHGLEFKIKRLLRHERIRKYVAKEGYKYVHSQATYTHRIQRALEIMKLK